MNLFFKSILFVTGLGFAASASASIAYEDQKKIAIDRYETASIMMGHVLSKDNTTPGGVCWHYGEGSAGAFLGTVTQGSSIAERFVDIDARSKALLAQAKEGKITPEAAQAENEKIAAEAKQLQTLMDKIYEFKFEQKEARNYCYGRAEGSLEKAKTEAAKNQKGLDALVKTLNKL
ncbi:MAG: hypothetical protein AB7P04_05070 [Bacteriovoracia bacterium]